MIKRLLSEWKEYSDKENILIYQMGKVGSTSLEQAMPGSIHLHTLYFGWPTHRPPSRRRNTLSKKIKGGIYDAMRRLAIKSRDEIKIITLVRDPYARNVSDFFQGFIYWMFGYVFNSAARIDTRANSDETLVYNAFDKVYDHDYALTWFDKEFKRMTGIDVYRHDFNKRDGWAIIKKGKYNILLIKLEKIKEVWNIIEDFAGIKMEYTNSNVASAKWYKNIYDNFTNNYKPTQQYLEKLYNSKLVKHFYTDDEVKFFINDAAAIKTKGK
jgi:hypothetical protein